MPKYRILSQEPRGNLTAFKTEFVLDDGHVEVQEYVGKDETVVQEAALHMQSEMDSRSSAPIELDKGVNGSPFKEVSRVNERIEVREV